MWFTRNKNSIIWSRAKTISRFTVIVLLLISTSLVSGSRKGATKGAPKITGVKHIGSTSKLEKYSSSSVATWGHPSCQTSDVLSDMRKNITTFKDSLKEEMERKLQALSDMIDQLMHEQTVCSKESEKKLITGNDCSEKKSEKISNPADEIKIPICESGRCKDISSRMLHTIDHSTDPCMDFYQYACGGLEEDPTLDPISPRQEAIGRIQEKLETLDEEDTRMGSARTFYDACLNWRSYGSQDSIAYARNIVHRIGWFLPSAMVGKSFGEDFSHLPPPTNLTHYLATFMKSDFTPFFEVSIEPDPSNKKHFVPRINLALNSHPNFEEMDHVTCIAAFKENVKKARRISKAVNLNQEYDTYIKCKKAGLGLNMRLERMKKAVSVMTLMDFIKNQTSRDELMADTKFFTEILLSDCAKDRPKEIDLKVLLKNKDYEVKMLEELGDSLGKMIDWEEFFLLLTGQKISKDQKIHVYHQKQISDVLSILNNEWVRNQAAVHNSFLMLWSDRVYSTLVSPLQEQSDYCLQSFLTHFPDISSTLYLHSFPDSQLSKLQRTVDTKALSLRRHLESQISTPDDYFSKELKKKIHSMKVNIGAVSDSDASVINDTLVNNLKWITINNKSHSENVDNLLQRKRRILYSLINQDTESPNALWMQNFVPYAQNGYASHELNTIYLPYGAFFPPYFYNRQQLPEYIYYGGLGHLLAVQMMQFLDETGIKHDGESKTKIDMPNSSLLSSECFVDELYRNFPLFDKGVTGNYLIASKHHINDLLTNSWATKLSWSAYHVLYHDAKEPTKPLIDSPEPHLIWMGATPLKPIKAYFLRIAQAQCSKASEFDLLRIMEDERMLPSHRVNLIMKNEKLFAEAFQCSKTAMMSSYSPCGSIFI